MEIKVANAQAYSRTCLGCQRHGADIMLSFQDDQDGQIHDVFMTEDQALALRVRMGEILERQETK